MGFKCGIVGLPNVGKSTLFNALTETQAAQAANYPFCIPSMRPLLMAVSRHQSRWSRSDGVAAEEPHILHEPTSVPVSRTTSSARSSSGGICGPACSAALRSCAEVFSRFFTVVSIR